MCHSLEVILSVNIASTDVVTIATCSRQSCNMKSCSASVYLIVTAVLLSDMPSSVGYCIFTGGFCTWVIFQKFWKNVGSNWKMHKFVGPLYHSRVTFNWQIWVEYNTSFEFWALAVGLLPKILNTSTPLDDIGLLEYLKYVIYCSWLWLCLLFLFGERAVRMYNWNCSYG